jgi:hypothetical protein
MTLVRPGYWIQSASRRGILEDTLFWELFYSICGFQQQPEFKVRPYLLDDLKTRTIQHP